MSDDVISLRLLIAAKDGNTRELKRLLAKHHAPIDSTSPAGRTALMISCDSERPETALELISRSADIHIRDETGSTALIYAASKGLIPVLKKLIKKGALLNSRRLDGTTALLAAVQQRHVDAALVLIEAGAEVDIQCDNGRNALFEAASLGLESIVESLLKAGADTEIRERVRGETPLMAASVNGCVEVCRLLLAHGADTTLASDAGHHTCLHFASYNGHSVICSMLMEAGAVSESTPLEGTNSSSLALMEAHNLPSDPSLPCVEDSTGSPALINAATASFIDLVSALQALHDSLQDHELGTLALVAFWHIIQCCHRAGGLVLVFLGRLFSRKPSATEATPSIAAASDTSLALVPVVVEEPAQSLVPVVVDEPIQTEPKACTTTPLHFAAIRGKPHVIDTLLDMGVEVNCTTEAGWTPLRFSVENGHLEATKRLIARGADVSWTNSGGITCLMLARDLPTVRELLAAGADPNAVDTCGASALHHIVQEDGNVGPVICALVQGGADPGLKNTNGRTPADLARLSSHFDTEALLLRITKQEPSALVPWKDRPTPEPQPFVAMAADVSGPKLWAAAKSGDISEVKSLLVEHNAPIDYIGTAGMTPLMVACSNCRSGAALELVSRSVDIYVKDDNGSTALEYAARGGLSYVLQELIKKGAPLNSRNKKGETALFAAVVCDQKDAVLVLLEAGAEVDIQSEDGRRPLLVAMSKGSEKIVTLLLKAGADANTIDQVSRHSPLMTATLSRRSNMCQLLLAHGADITVTDDEGYTCLHRASFEGYTDLCSALVEAGALVNCRTPAGETPLRLAAKRGHKDVCNHLIRHGADVSLTSVFYRVLKGLVAAFRSQLPAALVKAVREGQADVVETYNKGGRWWQFLTARSVDTSLTCNSLGHTLLHVAAIEGHHHIIDMDGSRSHTLTLFCRWKALGGDKAAHRKRR